VRVDQQDPPAPFRHHRLKDPLPVVQHVAFVAAAAFAANDRESRAQPGTASCNFVANLSPSALNINWSGGVRAALASDDVVIAFAAHLSRLAAWHSFQGRRSATAEAEGRRPTSVTSKGDWSKFSRAGS
jgi:hypothetical protein